VAGGDKMARFTCLDMLFHSFFDFGTDWIIADNKLLTPDALLAVVLDVLDSCSSFLVVLLGSSPWHFATLRRFCNPSSGG
jgi:hypothetical protein